MPTYDYRCRDCNKDFSVVMTMSEYDEASPPRCPHCTSGNVIRIYTGINVQTSRKS